MSQAPERHYRSDYQLPAYLIDDVSLNFDIQENNVEVTAEMAVRTNPDGPGGPWQLDGRGLRLVRIAIDGADRGEDGYHLTDTGLTLDDLPEAFTLTVVTEIDPETKVARFKVIGCDLWSDEDGFEEAVASTGVTGIFRSGIFSRYELGHR